MRPPSRARSALDGAVVLFCAAVMVTGSVSAVKAMVAAGK